MRLSVRSVRPLSSRCAALSVQRARQLLLGVRRELHGGGERAVPVQELRAALGPAHGLLPKRVGEDVLESRSEGAA